MAVNPIIDCFWRDLVPEYCQGLESSVVYTAPPFLSNPSMVTQIVVYLACCCICMQRILFLPSWHRTSISESAFPKPHPDTTPVIRNVRSLANRQNQQKRGRLGNFQLPPAKRHVSVPAGKRDSSQGGSSIPSTIQGQNSTPSSSLNNSRIADITQRVTCAPSTTQRGSIITPTATPGSSSRNTPAPSGTIQKNSTRRVVSSSASAIASTPTPLNSLEILPTPISNPDSRAIITNPLRTWATEKNQRQR